MLESLDVSQMVEVTKNVKEISTFEASLVLLSLYDSMMETTGNKKMFQGLKNRIIKKKLSKFGL